ncbi:MAG: hypothetical protein RIC19_03770 [Phaeodactylibacter sp.]|uniref:hypothetical protein n=1 Tax=Phaeodactylibacter sp. TaxID=1940289 RepID=UPI0032EF9D25
MKRIPAIIVFLSVLAGCQKAEEATPAITVDAAFQPYFERFEAEGVLRGLDIDLASEEIGAVFSDELVDGQAGLCTQYTSGISIIEIGPANWSAANDLEREHLIFHELGHCYLGRAHEDAKDAAGFCLSMMQSGNGSCRYNYRNVTRTAYLDELFGQN